MLLAWFSTAVDWGDIWTQVIAGVLLVVAGGMLTPAFWKHVGGPLLRVCRNQSTIAKQSKDNADRLTIVEAKVGTNGEQTAISIHQNKAILELLESATMQADAHGKVIWVSHRWTMMAGIQRDEAMGDGWMSAIRADDQERVIKLYESSIEKGRPLNVDFHFGTGQRVRQTMEPIKHGDTPETEKVIGWMSEFERIDNNGLLIGSKPVPVVPADF